MHDRPDADLTEALADCVRAASASRQPLRIVGGDTKRFYGRAVDAAPLEVAGHSGILNHDPAELVLTARAGTPLARVVAQLEQHGQCLPFEPPAFGVGATLGGTVASALAGPARVARGPVRDYVLGVRLLTGDGRVLRFGGEVMKNVAGYDVARLLVGSLGVLGVLLDVSLKVLPRAPSTRTVRRRIDADAALDHLATLERRGVPMTASFWHAGELAIRIEGASPTLDAAAQEIGGDALASDEAGHLWSDVREQRHPCFAMGSETLWRLHVPATAPPGAFERHAAFAFEWHGGQRWIAGLPATGAQALATSCEGHATLFRGATAAAEVFAPPPASLLALQRRVKRVFDPAGILNPGRLYAAL